MTPAVLSSTLVVLAVLEALAELFDELLADCFRLELEEEAADCFFDELLLATDLLLCLELDDDWLPHAVSRKADIRAVAITTDFFIDISPRVLILFIPYKDNSYLGLFIEFQKSSAIP